MKNKDVPLLCRNCLRPQMVTRAAASFWHANADIGYICPKCFGEQMHRAVEQCNIAALEAFTRAYKIAKAANSPQPAPLPPPPWPPSDDKNAPAPSQRIVNPS